MALVCANCGIEIRWLPTRIAGVVYCCAGCSQGGPCTCDYEQLPPAHAPEGDQAANYPLNSTLMEDQDGTDCRN